MMIILIEVYDEHLKMCLFPYHSDFCKPCSVPAYSNGDRLVLSGSNHLSTGRTTLPVPPSVHFLREGAPTIIWVSHSWGLPRSTFTVSSEATSLWHFSGSVDHIARSDLGLPSAVKALKALPYLIFSVSTNTTVISDPCEHGLSSTNENRLQRLLETTMI